MNDFPLFRFSEYVIAGNSQKISQLTTEALAAGVKPTDIIEKGLIPGMQAVGESFSNGDIYLPEMLISSRAMKTCLSILKPLLQADEVSQHGTIVIGTVSGDVHDIGKNIVAWMLEGAGFNVIDLGVDVPSEKFLEALDKYKPHILGLSSLLTTSTMQIKTVIEKLNQNGVRDRVKVLIGGASVNQSFADRVGADGYALDAVDAVSKANQLIAQVKQNEA